MSTQRQRRRGTKAEHATFTGAAGEVTLVTDEDRLRTHDGATAGGFPLALIKDMQESAGLAVAAGGSADALTAAPEPAWTAYADYQIIWIEATAANTGAATLAVSGLAAKALKKNAGADDLEAGDLADGGLYPFMYLGTGFQLVGGGGGGGGGVNTVLEVQDVTVGQSAVTLNGGTWTDYDEIEARFIAANNVTSGVHFYFQVTVGGVLLTSGYSNSGGGSGSGPLHSGSSAQGKMNNTTYTLGSGGMSGNLVIFGPGGTSNPRHTLSQLEYGGTPTHGYDVAFNGAEIASAGVFDGVKVYPSSGNLTGLFVLLGRKYAV